MPTNPGNFPPVDPLAPAVPAVPDPGTTPPADSGITPDDVARAQAAWRENASPRFKGLLDAKPVNPKRGRLP